MIRWWARLAHPLVAGLFVACAVVQVFLAGLGVFDLSALILVLFALQSVFVVLRPAMPALAALHPLNGFAILAVASITTRASWAVRRERACVTAALDGQTLAPTTQPGRWLPSAGASTT